MADRIKPIELSAFGNFLRKNTITRDQAAKDLGVTAAYISMLAHGKATPGLKLAMDISRWSARKRLTEVFTAEKWGV